MHTSGWTSAAEARDRGAALRDRVAHTAHEQMRLPSQRQSVELFCRACESGRIPALLPLRWARMSANPFAFFRGSAGLMAHDLTEDPITGIVGQICGDAHAANFGLYGGHGGHIVMDINDFDETVVGPWEWDLKRLTVSLVLAGRVGGAPESSCHKAARHAVRSYRRAFKHLADLPFLEAWMALGDESAIEAAEADALLDDFAHAADKAFRNDSEKAATKLTRRDDDGQWHFLLDPPILSAVDEETRGLVLAGLDGYVSTLRESRRGLIERYRPCDVAMRVVGTASVGNRVYVVLLQGNKREALVLQVKEAGPSALAPYLPAVDVPHDGARVVHGARLMQVETDLLLGWTDVDGRPFIVRQFRNRKGAIDPTALTPDHLDDYGRLAGALLARAHSRTIDPRVMTGYTEDGAELDTAIANYAFGYAEQVARDHAELVALIADGRIDSMPGPA